jgi:hypothetical protein
MAESRHADVSRMQFNRRLFSGFVNTTVDSVIAPSWPPQACEPQIIIILYLVNY